MTTVVVKAYETHLPWECDDSACGCLKREVQRLQIKVGLDNLLPEELLALVETWGGALVRRAVASAEAAR
jgi:hypothetical protein